MLDRTRSSAMWDVIRSYCPDDANRTLAEFAYHAGMVLFAVSYAVKDILWLRVLAVVAGLLGLPFFIVCPAAMESEGLPAASPGIQWQPIFWNSLFVTINVVRLTMLLRERRPVHLSEEEQRLHMLVFRSLAPHEFARLLDVAEWREAGPGEQLVEKGRALNGLLVLYSGNVGILNDGVEFAQSRDGQCIGEMSFVTGMPPSADVVARTELRYVFFPKADLDELMKRDDRIREVVHSVLGFDMAEKLTARTQIDLPLRRFDDAE